MNESKFTFQCHLLKAVGVDKCIETKEQDHTTKENGLVLSFKLYSTKQFQMWFCSACEIRVFDMKPYMYAFSLFSYSLNKKVLFLLLKRQISWMNEIRNWYTKHVCK